VTVEKVLDELWIGVKGQSNSEISCSLRNNFRVSLGLKLRRGRALNSRGGLPAYQRKSNSEYCVRCPGDRQWGISFIVKRGTAQIVD
jgi:hypothetical protein